MWFHCTAKQVGCMNAIKQVLPSCQCAEGMQSNGQLIRSEGSLNTHLTLLCTHSSETLFCHTDLNLHCVQPGSVEKRFTLQQSYHNMVRQLTWIHVLLPVRSWAAEHKTLVRIIQSINQSINLHFLSLGLIRGVNRQYLGKKDTKHWVKLLLCCCGEL